MEETIIVYASAVHLNSMSVLAKFISKHNPSLSVILLSCATEPAFFEPPPPPPVSAAASTAAAVTYRRLPSAAPPPDFTTDPVELVFEIPRLNRQNLRNFLEEITSAKKSEIKAFIIDFLCDAAFEVTTSLGIPSYYYVSCGAFFACALLYFPTIDEAYDEDIGDLNDFIHVPGCPPLRSSDFFDGMRFRKTVTYKKIMAAAKNMRISNGILVNSFDALEFRAKEALSNGWCMTGGAPIITTPPPVYLLGPLIDVNGGEVEEENECLRWLHSQPGKSVIFLCFGRWGFFSGKQLKEMAVGLEESGHRFLWSVRGSSPELDDVLPEGFLERTKERGLVVKSWVPQKEVLSHDSVAGFVTHCGRSSILEAISFGVPMIAWPMYAEQRMNRVFMVEEMKVALPLEMAAEDGFVTAAELEKRVRELMDSKMGRSLRHRVVEMQKSAQLAVRENGSSLVALDKFIHQSVTRD
ncbi:hypothetical protein ACP275_11G090300 [Erythranthe tilingii]